MLLPPGRGPLKDQTPVKVMDTEKKTTTAEGAGTAEVKEKVALAVRPLAVDGFDSSRMARPRS